MNCKNAIAFGVGMVAMAIMVDSAVATSWIASQSGYWTNMAVWGGGGTPGINDDATINSGVSVTVDVSTATLTACTVGGTLTFLGTNTSLFATTVTITSNVTHAVQGATTTNPAGEWVASNRVWIVCSNLTVALGGSINVKAKGYTGGPGTGGSGKGPGGSPYNAARPGGAGHGGVGGYGTSGWTQPGGTTYGSVTDPEAPGSGGASSGGASSVGGNGGGAVRIDATGHVLVNGTITAEGGSYSVQAFAASGSGGSILINCRTFASTNGTVSVAGALGGPGWGGEGEACGDGAGGRIAIHYDTTAQGTLNLTAKPTALISAAGACRYDSVRGEPGTVWVSDTSFWPPLIMMGGAQLPSSIPSFTSWSPASILISNTWVMIDPSLAVTVTNDVILQGAGARLDVGNGVASPVSFSCGRDLVVTNSAFLYARAGVTNGAMTNSLQILVGRNMTVFTGATVRIVSNPTNGGCAKFNVGSMTVTIGGTLDAWGQGYWGGTVIPRYPVTHVGGWGPGGGACGSPPYRGGGGGYGGKGGNSEFGNAGGNPYGSSNIVLQCGSGGGANDPEVSRLGGPGGGLIWVEANLLIRVDGVANANAKTGGSGGGGGAGGGIYLRCRRFMGNGALRADGTNGSNLNGQWSGGGGGGRIAVWRTDDFWTGTTTVSGGVANVTYDGAPGTIVWGNVPAVGTVIMIR